MKGVIYKYTFPNGKVYIGQTINPRSRMVQHLSKSTGPRNVGFWRAYKKYGSFEYEELEKISAPDEYALRDRLNLLEQQYIEKYHSNNRNFGYNLTSGGKVFVVNDEGRQHMSEARTDKMPVLQYTLDGDFVQEYESTTAAAKAIHSHASSIYACCVGESRSLKKRHKVQIVKGFTFRFKSEYPDVPKHIDIELTSNRKPILQYSLKGEFIREWDSVMLATKELHNKSISAACNGVYRQAAGFMWRFRDESSEIPLTITPVRPKQKRPFPKLSPEQVAKGKAVHFEKYARPVYQFTFDGSFVAEYPSIRDAAKAINGDAATVCNACRDTKVKSAYGYLWRYKKEIPYPEKGIEPYVQELGPRKTVLQLKWDGTVLKEWHCAKDVTDYYGVCRNSVYLALAGKLQLLKGYVWKYKNEYDENSFPGRST